MLKKIANALLDILYPEVCLCCQDNYPHIDRIFCTSCAMNLHPTNHHILKENDVTDRFWGRLPQLYSAASLFEFTKGGTAQKLIHQLKYHNHPEIGNSLGRYYSNILKDSYLFQDITHIIPVPLHPKKKHMRGYNQAEMFAQGISQGFPHSKISNALIRNSYTETQTRMDSYKRFQNVEKVFDIKSNYNFEQKHILLVDDVITTGATLEACANLFKSFKGVRISIASIALTIH